MITINSFEILCFNYKQLCPNIRQGTSNVSITWKHFCQRKKEAKTALFMKVLLTMYNRRKAFINNMDTFHIFKTSQNIYIFM